MKGLQSGMPAEDYWSSFFDANCILSKLEFDEKCGDVLEPLDIVREMTHSMDVCAE